MARAFICHVPKPARTRVASSPARQVRLITAADLARAAGARGAADSPAPAREIGGPPGPEPTRYGDWERNGLCIDF